MEIVDLENIRIIDVIDVLLIILLLYYVYRIVKGTVAINIFIGVLVIYAFWEISNFLQMKLISNLIGGFLGVGMFALIVLFQQEIRKFLLMLGSTNFSHRGKISKHINYFFSKKEVKTNVFSILEAYQKMSDKRLGALVVIQRNNKLDFLKESGDIMNIEINRHIIETIFFKNSPLHDGAVLIEDNKITATRLILPVSSSRELPLRLGLRHRAAVGITERTDALCLVLSEETGEISYIKDGRFIHFKTILELEEILKHDLK